MAVIIRIWQSGARAATGNKTRQHRIHKFGSRRASSLRWRSTGAMGDNGDISVRPLEGESMSKNDGDGDGDSAPVGKTRAMTSITW